MAVPTETDFPRGGRKPPTLSKLDKKSRPTFKLFGKKNKTKKKNVQKNTATKKIVKEKFKLTDSEPISSISASLVTYRTLQEGMVVLGCIKHISKMGIKVSLPGRIFGIVPITHISGPYTKLLKSLVEENTAPDEYEHLSKLFEVGQYVRCKVMEVARTEGNELYRVTASLAPNDVQSSWKHGQLKKGLIVAAAVVSIEDHGYVMDVGVNNTRAFLSRDDVRDKLGIGQVIWCSIKKSTSTDVASTLVLKRAKVFSKQVFTDVTLNSLLPGMSVHFTIEKILKDGYEGTFFDKFIGYVSESHLENPLDTKSKHKVGDTVVAYMLYTMPTTKLTYFTLHDLGKRVEFELTEGHITNATILSRTNKGLYVKLMKAHKGFISYRRLKMNRSEADVEELLNSYSINSKHRCRVLDFDYMENVYICTMEKHLLNEEYFSLRDFQVGQVVSNVAVEKITANGLEVRAGRVHGFIKKLHLADVPLQSALLQKKFQIGQKLKARVLTIDREGGSIYFTLKQTLIDSKFPCLTSYEDIDKNQQYEGVIVQITDRGVLVVFYNDVRGWLPSINMNLDKKTPLQSVFYLGQVIKCSVLSVNLETLKVILTLRHHKKQKVTMLKIGEIVEGTVQEKNETELTINIDKTEGVGFLRVPHLTDHVQLAPLLAETYKPETNLSDLICIGLIKQKIYLSKRDTLFLRENLVSFDDLKEGALLKCSLNKVDKNGILLYATISNFKRYVYVSNKELEEALNLLQDILSQYYHMNISVRKMKCLKVDSKSSIITKNNHCKRNVRSRIAQAKNLFANKRELLTSTWESGNDCLKLSYAALPYTDATRGSWVNQKGACSRLLNVVLPMNDKIKFVDKVSNDNVLNLVGENINILKHITDEKLDNVSDLNLKKYQPIMAKVKKITEEPEQTIIATTKLSECWDKTLTSGVDLLESYIIDIDTIRENGRSLSNESMYNISLGQRVQGKITEVHDSGNYSMKISGLDIQAVVPKGHSSVTPKGRLSVKDKVNGVILWVDYPSKTATVSLVSKYLDLVPEENDISSSNMTSGKTVKCEILLTTNDFSLAVWLSEANNKEFVFLPVRVHYNDFTPNTSDYKRGDVVFVKILKIVNNRWCIGILKNKKLKKQKTDNNDEDDERETVKKEEVNLQEISKKLNKTNKRKMSTASNKESPKKKLKPGTSSEESILPGADSFWTLTQDEVANDDSQVASAPSDVEEEEDAPKKKKKKKLTRAEKIEEARAKEEQIRQKETLLADESAKPTSAEQFDRLVMAQPNSSHAWISYMAFHLETAEFVKARSIARKALSTISFREEQEKLNVWVALLNLENRYGTKQSFSSTLEEAIRVNDARIVYTKAMRILVESKKQREFVDLMKTFIRKFKHIPETWHQAATECYAVGLFDVARDLIQRALACLEKKEHANLIVKYAHLEVQHGFQDRGETLFEQVLMSYQKRVDVWCAYVDVLVKASRIDLARKTLIRAVACKLSPRKMKTMFKKFIEFEEAHGTEETVNSVRQRATQYVQLVTSQ